MLQFCVLLSNWFVYVLDQPLADMLLDLSDILQVSFVPDSKNNKLCSFSILHLHHESRCVSLTNHHCGVASMEDTPAAE